MKKQAAVFKTATCFLNQNSITMINLMLNNFSNQIGEILGLPLELFILKFNRDVLKPLCWPDPLKRQAAFRCLVRSILRNDFRIDHHYGKFSKAKHNDAFMNANHVGS